MKLPSLLVVSALLFWLSFNGYGFLLYVSCIPLFYVLHTEKTSRKGKGIILLGILGTIGATCWWMSGYSLESFLFASIFVTSAISGGLSIGQALHLRNIPFLRTYAYSFGLLCSFLLFSMYKPLSFLLSWQIVLPLQPASTPLLTPLGVLFFVFLGQEAIVHLCIARERKNITLLIFAVSLGVLFTPVTTSFVPQEMMRIGLIQGNIQESWEWRVTHAQEILTHYLSLSYKAVEQNATLIIWPEYALPIDIFQERDSKDQLHAFVNKVNRSLLIGTLKKVQLPAFPHIRHADSAVLFTPGTTNTQVITSTTPFPTERWVIPDKWGPSMITVNNQAFAVLLCFEEVAPGIANNKAKNTQGVLVLANDYLIPSERGVRIASSFTALRAVETRKAILRVANTGETKIVLANGKTVAALPLNQEGVLIYDFPFV